MTLIQLRKPALIISGIVLFYALSGFFIIPALVAYKLPEIIKEETGRTAAIADIYLNPFTWELRLKDFEMQEHSGQAFVAFDNFYLNFNAVESLFKLALTFDQISLSKPYVRLEKQQSGEFNFSDLITEQEPEDEPEEDPSEEVFPLTIHKLTVDDGKLRWEDKHFSDPVEENLFPINLDLDGFTTIKDNRSDLGFSLDLGSGGSLEWSGKLSVNPIHSEGHIRLAQVKSNRLWEFLLQDKVQFELTDGENLLEADYKVSFENYELQLEVVDGRLDINN